MQNQQRKQLLLMETVSRSVPEAARDVSAPYPPATAKVAAKEAVAVPRSAPVEAPQTKEATLVIAGTPPSNRFFQPRPDLFENVNILVSVLSFLGLQ